MSAAPCVRRWRLRMALYVLQQGRCWWCHKMMDPYYPEGSKFAPGPLTITIDHLDSRLNPGRGNHVGRLRKVAACSRCNGLRSERELSRLPRETLREMARSGHRRTS